MAAKNWYNAVASSWPVCACLNWSKTGNKWFATKSFTRANWSFNFFKRDCSYFGSVRFVPGACHNCLIFSGSLVVQAFFPSIACLRHQFSVAKTAAWKSLSPIRSPVPVRGTSNHVFSSWMISSVR